MIGLRSADGRAGLVTVADGGADGEADDLPSKFETVDLHPDPPVELVEAEREGRGDVEAGSAVIVLVFWLAGRPKPRAEEKNDSLAGGGSLAGGVTTGSGSEADT
jgi:hypothetical protein